MDITRRERGNTIQERERMNECDRDVVEGREANRWLEEAKKRLAGARLRHRHELQQQKDTQVGGRKRKEEKF